MYDEILLEHNLYPKNRGKLEGCEIFRELKNASCGDKIFVQLKIRNGVIVDGKFEGVGCAIALASADLMIDVVRGKTIAQAKDKMGEAIALKIVERMPARAKCAELAWRVFSDK